MRQADSRHGRQQALKAAYQAVPTRAGVFLIRNTVSRRLRVVASRDVDGALNRARFELRLGTHRDAALQEDWRRHGEASFVFAVLDRVQVREAASFNEDAELATLLALWQPEMSAGEALPD